MRPFITALLTALALVAGCAPAPRAEEPSPAAPEPTAGSALPSRPETAEDRAQSVLAELRAYCGEHDEECGAVVRPDAYPDIEVAEAERRYVNDRRQELRTLGVQLRWDPGTSRFEVDRGNTPIFGALPRDDP